MTSTNDLIEWLRAKYRRHGELEDQEAADEIERLRRQVQDAELSLRVFDPGRESEYWLRHTDQTPEGPT